MKLFFHEAHKTGSGPNTDRPRPSSSPGTFTAAGINQNSSSSGRNTPITESDLVVLLLEERKEKQFRVIWRNETVFLCFTCMLICSFWMDGWMAKEWMRTEFYRLMRLWKNPRSVLGLLNFHACLASAALPPFFLWPNNSLIFLLFTDSFLFLSSSERFHASAHRRSLWEHQCSDSAAQ